MDFRDRDGEPLLPWKHEQEAFEAWKRMSAGRPCDYTGMTYERLTGGSGIQWPCNKGNPEGTERLFTNGAFYTDIENCESYCHDLETGAPLTKREYGTMNPRGRAILKAADYLPVIEGPDDEYPLQLSTGRLVYHFYTRTKTGRSKELEGAAPEPRVEISEQDAAALRIEVGDQSNNSVKKRCRSNGSYYSEYSEGPNLHTVPLRML